MIWYSLNLFVIITLIILFIIVRSSNKSWEKTRKLIDYSTKLLKTISLGNLPKKIENLKNTSQDTLTESINQLIDNLRASEEKIKEEQSELINKNEFLENIINSLSDGLIIVDNNAQILKITPIISTWFENKNLIGQNLFDFIELPTQTDIANFHNTEIYIKDFSSDIFEASSIKLNTKDKDTKYIILIKNVTNQKELDTLKEDFVATLTHDLKVPIIAELNMLDFLINETFGEINEKQKEVLEKMKYSNKEVLDLVQILLETYKNNNTEIELYKEEIELNAIINDTVEEMQIIANKNNVKINFEQIQNTTIKVDKFQFKRVLQNLIQNAISYSEQNNKIDIKTEIQNNFLSISIIDYGKGINENDINLIFNKYYSTAKKYRKIGTGLGLYLSKQIIEAHDGEISVNSLENIKTEFKIKLPI